MTGKQIIINGIDVSRCEYRDWRNSCHCDNSKENEGEKRVTGRGGCKYNPNCYYKQLKRKEKECEELKKTIMYKCPQCGDEYLSPIGVSLYEENNKLKQTLAEIIRFFEEDEKFARYSGRPIIFVKPTLEKIEKILKENDIKIS